MRALDVVLVAGAAWSAAAMAGYLLVLPIFTVARRAGGAPALERPAYLEPLPASSRSRARERRTSLHATGYAGLVLERLAAHACAALGADQACIVVRRGLEDETTIVVAGHGVDEDLIGSRLAWDAGACGMAMASGRPVVVPDLRRLSGSKEDRAHGGARGAAAAPVGWDGAVRGAVSVALCGEGRELGFFELELLTQVAALAGRALEHHGRRELSASSTEAEVSALTVALERLDRRAGRHAGQVCELAIRVGQALGLGPVELIELELAAQLHDVGKVRVPPSIVRKAEPLSPEELEVMRLHPVWGAELVATIPGLEAVALLVRLHHERWDGGGYPDGLAGRRIPLASRIIAACDAWGAMGAERPYRPALSTEAAIAELRAGAGAQFDRRVVDALADAIRLGGGAGAEVAPAPL